MSKALVLYTTRTNQTKGIGELIAEGLREAGVDVTIMAVQAFEQAHESPEAFDALVLGSATYHGEMMQPMKTFLFKLEQYDLKGKVGGAFGSFGWSGEAPGRIFETMKNIYQMDMVSGPLKLKSGAMSGAVSMAKRYAQEIARKLQSGA
ncbi:flavodoxin-like protein [Desulfosoma caldarium]|uniref:Flavodoxin-like protein n=1 Tax=Desulfosoma caldarium TaxID=610254 RepID=A0A3N1VMV5_9BACT|nr:flavodoxin domain-containing protein [Desulfosoma caldarium]ROR03280.1 flavodoxin-like protein [Desulfosoma caldarium]